MFLQSLEDSRRRFEEVVNLATQLEQTQPDDLTQLKATQAAVAIAIKLEQFRQTLLRNLNSPESR